MTNPNVSRGIGSSAERSKFQEQSGRPFHQNEQQFYVFHPPMPTENGKKLQEFFDERTKFENEKFSLMKEERKLVDRGDDLRHELKKIEEKGTSSVEEEMKKEEEIKSLNEEIQKVEEELMKVREEIAEKEDEIDRTNEKINEMTEIVIEDEHKLVQQQQEFEKERNDIKVEALMNQL